MSVASTTHISSGRFKPAALCTLLVDGSPVRNGVLSLACGTRAVHYQCTYTILMRKGPRCPCGALRAVHIIQLDSNFTEGTFTEEGGELMASWPSFTTLQGVLLTQTSPLLSHTL